MILFGQLKRSDFSNIVLLGFETRLARRVAMLGMLTR